MIQVATYAHDLIKQVYLEDKITVDMTCGRGNDTLFLSNVSKKVYAFDIQMEAIESTRNLLKENHRDNVYLIHDSNEFIDQYVHEEIGAIIYNLGYLPHGSKEIFTSSATTIKSLVKALPQLMHGGICVIVVYQKHDGDEAMIMKHYCSNLPSREYDVMKYSVINKELAPYIIKISKLEQR